MSEKRMQEESRPPSEEGTIERVRGGRFGWQPSDKLVYFDDEGNRITEAEFRHLVAASPLGNHQ